VSVKTPAQTERQFERAIVELAELNRWATYHTFDSRRSNPGFPDLVLARSDRLIFAELKSDTGRVSKAQEAWLDALRFVAEAVRSLTGEWFIRVVVWRPCDWKMIEKELAR
jgi:VRR-NUC domain